MLFNSFSFLLDFLPASLLAYYAAALVSRHLAAGVLVAASFIFYGWWNPALLVVLIGSIAFNYLCSLLLFRFDGRERAQKICLFLGIAGNLILLFYYKYFFPILGWLGAHGLATAWSGSSIALPLGISFFTFTQIGYLVDCQAGLTKGTRLIDYMLFVTFFPHLIAGPILHHREMMPQFGEAATYRFRWESVVPGLTIFIMGLAKKVLIADHFAPFVAAAFSDPGHLPAAQAWAGALSYCLQLYFDFSGYSEMAMGLAKMFGIVFPANFNSPFKARSIIDYWHRWHMTLTRYLNLYLYNPVALWVTRRRIRRGRQISKKATAQPMGFLSMIAFPTFFTMGLAGIWHGAGLQFLVFGLLHSAYITINHGWRIWGPKKSEDGNALLKALSASWRVGLTTLCVILAQVFFRSASVTDALHMLHSMTNFHGAQGAPNLNESLSLIAGFIFVWTMPNILEIMAPWQPSLTQPHTLAKNWALWRPGIVWAIGTGAILGAALAVIASGGISEFLYFRF